MAASSAGKIEIVKYLVENGADINLQVTTGSKTFNIDL